MIVDLDFWNDDALPTDGDIAALMIGADDLVVTIEDLVARPAWHQEAACRGADPDLFFPERGQSVAPARELCDRCPVRAECLDVGLGERFGIWGGTSERERRHLRRAS